ncbi:MAG: TauD/TfdA family dioxygenase [Acidimicrobiia bacterium]|nr:TauD/TfdA family dioxygenase [Acidimicrobiia bacterium]
MTDTQPGARNAAKRVSFRGYDVQVGPLGHLADERQRLDALTWQHFDVRRMAATIGAEISGVDLTVDQPDEVIDELQQALTDYKVLFFRDQPLTPGQHVAFAKHFGELEVHPFIPSNTGEPELVRFAKSADVGGYENGWHHDVTWREIPSQAAILHAIEVPPTGGDTLFSDAHAAWQGLDDDTKAQIADLDAVHDYMLAFSGQVPEGKEEETRAKYPLVEHPVVCRHARSGQELLYVNRFFTSHIAGWDIDESRALIDRLSRQFEQLEYQCRFQWEPHSVAFWDNRAVQHYAASDYWPDVRVMERASIIGDRPSR